MFNNTLLYTCILSLIDASFNTIALKYHPDTSNTKNATEEMAKKEEFIKISEAWSVLSKPELKSQYDTRRKEYLIRNGGSAAAAVSSSSNVAAEIHQAFHVQRANYAKVQYNASSNWQELQEKYRTEKWQKMPLKDKKASRVRPIVSPKGGFLAVAIPTVIASYAIYSMFTIGR
ncbi:hypothetical protein EON64_05270 [archaeon]|nr:MAG: hypothetical protein EON64_05270 [archaeon]